MNRNNLLKKIAVTTSLLIALGLVASPVLAQTASPAVSNRGQQVQTQRISNLKMRADKEIDRRVASLNSLISHINNIKKLTDNQKSTLLSDVQSEITNLTTLRSKTDTDSDLVTLKVDVKSIIDSYRVYALYIPMINLITVADRMSDTADKFNAIATKIQTRIQAAKTAGKDVTALQASLTDMQSKITDARNQAQQIINTVTPLTPAGYPGNKTTLQSARTMLKTGQNDFKVAMQDARSIVSALRAMGLKQTGASQSANQ